MLTGTEVLDRGLFTKLKGSYAHKLDDNGEVQYQARVIAVKGKELRLQFFEWFMGEPSDQGWVTQLEFEKWRFYDSEDEWRKRGTASNRRLVDKAEQRLNAGEMTL